MGAEKPLSKQIYEYIKKNIERGVYNNCRLPTETELAEQFYVSRITTKAAMKLLADEGLIVRIRGKGSFVNDYSALSPFKKNGDVNNKIVPTIALIMGGYTSAFGLDVLNGAIQESQQNKFHLILCRTDNSQRQETEIVSSLISSGVKGIIIQPVLGETYSKDLVEAIYSGFPIVMLDRHMEGIGSYFVGVDNYKLTRYAVEKLIEYGHKNIALFALSDERSSTIKERMDGFKDACLDHHIMVDKDLWLSNINSLFDHPSELLDSKKIFGKYVNRIEKHLLKHPNITAIFGTEYQVSKAAWEALRNIGKSIPEEVSLVSFDIDSSYVGSHTMSYIKQPQYDMGRKSVELLIKIINGDKIKYPSIILDGEWIDGGTIARINQFN